MILVKNNKKNNKNNKNIKKFEFKSFNKKKKNVAFCFSFWD